MKHDSLRKLSRNASLYDLHLAHPELSYTQLAEKMLPWGHLSRERVRQLLVLERERRSKIPVISK